MKRRAILRAAPAIMTIMAVLKAALVGLTWWHAHWSIALSLTLLTLQAEVNEYIRGRDSRK